MVDVFISYASADQARVSPMVARLKAEGWSVWDHASDDPSVDAADAERQLGSAGAVFVVWSATARMSERMRSEAGSGLYKNKLVQVRVDGSQPPRPFDQVEVAELGTWDDDPDDGRWRRVVAAIRVYAGTPGSARPQVVRVAAAASPATASVMSSRSPAAQGPAAQGQAALASDRRENEVDRRVAGGHVGGRIETRERRIAAGERRVETTSRVETTGRGAASERARVEQIHAKSVEDAMISTRESERRAAEVRAAGYHPTSSEIGGGMVLDDADAERPRLRLSVVAVAVAAVAGLAWAFNPFGEGRSGSGAASASSGAKVMVDSAAADAAWGEVDRTNPSALRAFIANFGGAPAAESARSVLRVLDAQAWAEAVISDTEAAYSAYLASFPHSDTTPGVMAKDATERLNSLGLERQQAISAIQSALQAMSRYNGAQDGAPNAATVSAVRAFSADMDIPTPDLVLGAPRDIRAYADRVMLSLPEDARARLASGAAPAGGAVQQASVDTTAAARAQAEAQAAARAKAAADAAEAESRRIEDARRAVQQAEAERTRVETAERVAAERAAAERAEPRVDASAAAPAPAPAEASADTLALEQLQRAEAAGWASAQAQNTLAGFQAYLRNFPNGANAATARTEVARLSRPAPYSAAQLPAPLRTAVEAARAARTTAEARAAAARSTAQQADRIAQAAATGAGGAATIVAPDGDRYDAQVSNGVVNGLGVRVSGDEVSRGDRYRGQLQSGLSQGLGVFEFAENPNNAAAGALRYEGEHARDAAAGLGVTYWRNGNVYAGEDASSGEARGVMTFADGQRYDGELRNGQRNGFGVVWSATGEPVMAGRWENGELVEPVPVAP
ncbi:TIR domain-containing protein [bacterium]|nr:TIR domain-containing protein [bacterium]